MRSAAPQIPFRAWRTGFACVLIVLTGCRYIAPLVTSGGFFSFGPDPSQPSDASTSDTTSDTPTDNPPTTTDDPPIPVSVSYSAQIQPIFDSYCIRCHVYGGFADQSGIPLKLVEGVSYGLLVDRPSAQLPTILLVAPGDSAASLLYLKLSSDAPPVGMRMPWDCGPAPTPDELELIRRWIDEGAENN
jgi:hypothetical protein